MAITIDGTAGTIAGLVAGGLPSGSVTSATIANATIAAGDIASGVIPAGGKVLQVVTGRAATARESTNSTSWVQMGASVIITPASASSKILILCGLSMQKSGQYAQFFDFSRRSPSGSGSYTMNISGLSGGILTQSGSDMVNWTSMNMHLLDSPNTTNSVEYSTSCKVSNSALTCYYNDYGADQLSPLTLMEIAG